MSQEENPHGGVPNEEDDNVQGDNGSIYGDVLTNVAGNELNNIPGDMNEDEVILNALADVEVNEEVGPAIAAHVADAFNKTVNRKLSKETEERLKRSIKIPGNCTVFRVPKVNPEIWSSLPTKPKIHDLRNQQGQGALSTALNVLAMISDKIAAAASRGEIPKNLAGDILKMSIDGTNVIGNSVQEINARRKQEIKPFLHQDYRGICNEQTVASEYLFGDRLAESLKASKASAAVIRHSTLSRNRYQPYSSSSRSSVPLNSNRPYNTPRYQLYGQQFRPRGNNTQRQQFHRPRAQNPNFRPRY